MRINLLDELAKKKIFTIDDAAKITSTNRSTLKVILSRLEKKGWIERIEPGKYMIIPLGAEKGKYTLHEFIIADLLVDPCIISYWSALNHYGFTEQIPITVFIQTTARKKQQKINIFGVNYRIIRIKKEKIFGTTKEWFENKQVQITDKEKTIIDCLDKPQHSGGIIETAKALKTKNYDIKKLKKYSKKINNTGVTRRLGYLCEKLEIPIKIPKINTRNYLYLDPTISKKGKTNSKWKLYINTDIGELE
ncbi:MAG: type IV toxin-antitoxin system AbiEi family antitoxin domain-containing protein [Candidatus Thermoplasmatota archaeon]